MPPESIYSVAARFRDDLEARELEARRTMLAAWEGARRTITREVGNLTVAISERDAAGQRVPVSWLFAHDRLGSWERLVARELAAWRRKAEPAARKLVHRGATLGPEHATAMIRVRAVPFPPAAARRLVRFRPELVETMASHLEAESPLPELLARANLAAAGRMRETLLQGVGLGRDPRQVARALGEDLDEGFRRGYLIARTEGQRAYRETTRRTYRANEELLAGWRWLSSLDRRTCPACFAMHGTMHRLEERLDGHPACRCTMVPELRPDTGVSGPSIPLGSEVFAGLPEGVQARILGPGRFALYASGQANLSDFVERPAHPRWGPMRRVATLGRARANAAVRRRGGLTPGEPGGPTTTGPAPVLPPPPPAPAPIAPPPPALGATAELQREADRLRAELAAARALELRRMDAAMELMDAGDEAAKQAAFASFREARDRRQALEDQLVDAERRLRELVRAEGPRRYVPTDGDRESLESDRRVLAALTDDLREAEREYAEALRHPDPPPTMLRARAKRVEELNAYRARLERDIRALEDVLAGAEVRGIDPRMIEVTDEVAASPSLGLAEDALRRSGLRVSSDARLGDAPVQVRRERLPESTGADLNPFQFPDHVPLRLNSVHAHDTENEAFSLLHELGHWLDADQARFQWRSDQAIAGALDYDLPGADELREVMKLASESAEIQRLRNRLESMPNDEYAKYALQPIEVWARAFSQWVVLRSEGADSYGLRYASDNRSTQWNADDFAPIAKAIDRYLEAAGWL